MATNYPIIRIVDAAGKVHFHRNTHEVVNEWVAQQHALNPR